MKLDERDTKGTEVSDIKPQDHRNMQHNAWKIYAEERFKYSHLKIAKLLYVALLLLLNTLLRFESKVFFTIYSTFTTLLSLYLLNSTVKSFLV